jgi:hypothetical protein
MVEDQVRLDPATCDRVTEHLARFARSLDAVVAAKPAAEALEDLRGAADGLMRAVGRVMIELGKG